MGVYLGKLPEDYYTPQNQTHQNFSRIRIVGTTCVNCAGIKEVNTWNWETIASATTAIVTMLILCFIYVYVIYWFSRSKKDPQSLPCAERNQIENNIPQDKKNIHASNLTKPQDDPNLNPSSLAIIAIENIMVQNYDDSEKSVKSSKESIYDEVNCSNYSVPTNLFKDAPCAGLQTSMATWEQRVHQNIGITLV